jgi:tetratricopeptide (TPR) repeat protein
VPTGSALQILVQGGKAPSLRLGGEAKIFENLGEESWRLETKINSGDRLSVHQGWSKPIDWPLVVIPDRPPTVSFTSPPQDEKGRLGIEYLAEDDYAIASVTLLVRRIDPEGEGAELELPIGLPAPRPTSARHLVWNDFSPHPWAGTPVGLQLIARDEAGHVTVSELITFTLPEREFRHPVARALIEVRKHISQYSYRRASAIASLEELLIDPSAFDHDVTAYMAITVAASRLANDFSESAIPSTIDLLWKAALRIEDGKLADSARALEEARKGLREALQRNASNDEISRKLDDLRKAMVDHLQALAKSLSPSDELESDEEMLDAEELSGLMAKIDELDKLGRRETAEKLLSELDQMMQALQNARPMDAETKKAMKEMRALRKTLEDIVQRQEKLIEDTQKAIQAKPTDPDAPRPGELAARQDILREELDQKLEQMKNLLGDVPADLEQAMMEMDEAAIALSRFLPRQALKPEQQALELLKKGSEAAKENAMQKLGRNLGLGFGGRPQAGSFNRDPLGRPNGAEDKRLGLPSDGELRKAREILDELRYRAGEFRRPKPERDYIERLLKMF